MDRHVLPGQRGLFGGGDEVAQDVAWVPHEMRAAAFATWFWSMVDAVRLYGAVEVVWHRADRGSGSRTYTGAAVAAEFAAALAGAGYSVGTRGGRVEDARPSDGAGRRAAQERPERGDAT